jgi:hypothetical protein
MVFAATRPSVVCDGGIRMSTMATSGSRFDGASRMRVRSSSAFAA